MTEQELAIQKVRAVRARRRRERERRRRKRQLCRALGILLFLVILIAVCLNACGKKQTETEPDTQQTLTVTEAEPDNAQIEEAEEVEVEEEEEEITLTTEEMLDYITQNPDLYTESLIEFAQRYEQTIPFVYLYPQLYGITQEIDLTAEAAGDTVPLLIQWDARWGYVDYGTGIIGYNGCGPTCLSMVLLYLTHDATYTPVYVAEFSEQNGYYVSGSGTTWALFSQGAVELGLSVTSLSVSESAMANALEAGKPIICNVGPGYFTKVGHYIVITGYQDGVFTVNDPNSPDNSSVTWTFDQISDQIKGMWCFALSE